MYLILFIMVIDMNTNKTYYGNFRTFKGHGFTYNITSTNKWSLLRFLRTCALASCGCDSPALFFVDDHDFKCLFEGAFNSHGRLIYSVYNGHRRY